MKSLLGQKEAEWDWGKERFVLRGDRKVKLIAEEIEGPVRVTAEVEEDRERVVLMFGDGEQEPLADDDPYAQGLLSAAEEMTSPTGRLKRRSRPDDGTMSRWGQRWSEDR